jgi:hypothetical protein
MILEFSILQLSSNIWNCSASKCESEAYYLVLEIRPLLNSQLLAMENYAFKSM